MPDLFIHNIKQLITPLQKHCSELKRTLHSIDSAAIIIENGVIKEIGKESELKPKITANCPTLDAKDTIALPGLIDCHTHPVYVGNRADEFHMRNAGKSYLEIAAAGGGIQASARNTRNASVEQIVEESLPRFQRSLRSGVTTIEGKSGYGLEWQGEVNLLSALRVINSIIPQRLERTFLVHVLPENYADKRELFCDEVINEMIPQVVERDLATAADIFCETGAFTVDESRRILTAAKDNGLAITIHSNQFGNSGGALLAAELGARSADHLEYLNDAEIKAMVEAGVAGVILPACVFFLNSIPYPPARKMIESGMRIAIATDCNPGTSMTESIPFSMTTAAIYCKMTPEELLWAVTLDAARVLGRDTQIGSLEAGKLADITLWNIPNLETLSYHFGLMEPSSVLIDGKVMLSNFDESRKY
ncbi:imidazolonepropionase [bacterium]|nr:imidazolonepropionase [bacterium]MBU1919814.1 imidazolonepropionase [bacterium]